MSNDRSLESNDVGLLHMHHRADGFATWVVDPPLDVPLARAGCPEWLHYLKGPCPPSGRPDPFPLPCHGSGLKLLFFSSEKIFTSTSLASEGSHLVLDLDCARHIPLTLDHSLVGFAESGQSPDYVSLFVTAVTLSPPNDVT